MSLTNPNTPVSQQDLQDFYHKLLPYMGGSFGMIANKFSKGDMYSTDEKMVGQSIDGRPIYQKTITIPTSSSGRGVKSISLGLSDVKEICVVSSWSYLHNGSYTEFIPFVDTWDSHANAVGYTIVVSSGSPTLQLQRQMWESWGGLITVRYTKTTDSAISIGDDTDYSTEEKIVGTWIDGKPIYQKTINFGALPNTTTKEVASGLSNITVIDIKVIANSTGYSMTVPYISSDSNKHVVTHWYDYSTNKIGITTTNDRSAFSAYVTLQYTKTTD